MRYRIDIAFYREAESWQEALLQVEDGVSADLARDYDFIDWDELNLWCRISITTTRLSRC